MRNDTLIVFELAYGGRNCTSRWVVVILCHKFATTISNYFWFISFQLSKQSDYSAIPGESDIDLDKANLSGTEMDPDCTSTVSARDDVPAESSKAPGVAGAPALEIDQTVVLEHAPSLDAKDRRSPSKGSVREKSCPEKLN
jgi:hypothetical protein